VKSLVVMNDSSDDVDGEDDVVVTDEDGGWRGRW